MLLEIALGGFTRIISRPNYLLREDNASATVLSTKQNVLRCFTTIHRLVMSHAPRYQVIDEWQLAVNPYNEACNAHKPLGVSRDRWHLFLSSLIADITTLMSCASTTSHTDN